jgi:hypothetical protein
MRGLEQDQFQQFCRLNNVSSENADTHNEDTNKK